MRRYVLFITVIIAYNSVSAEFIKNQGQLVDEYGNDVNHVLFSFKNDEMNIHFTETGIIYHFWKIEYGLHQKIMTGQNHGLTDRELEDLYKNGLEDDTKLKFYRVDLLFNTENTTPKVEGLQKKKKYSNYYTPKFPDGLMNVPHYESIKYHDIYPNIDIVFYFEKGNLKYDIIVREGGKLSDINFEYVGADELKIDDKGNLIVKCMPGNIVEKTPFSFYKYNQEIIDIRYSIDGLNLRFKPYSEIDESKSIIVDPELIWSTYYNDGTSSTTWTTPVMDNDGNIFNAGYTSSNTFPLVEPGGDEWYSTISNSSSAVIVKFGEDKQPEWATYYSGSHNNYVAIGFSGGRGGLDVDSNGNIYVLGRTQSSPGQTFPTYDQGGGSYYQTEIYGETPYILKFDNDGVRLWATMFSTETASSSPGYSARSLRVGNNDQLYVAGECYRWMEGGAPKDFPLRNPGGGAYYKGTRVESQVPTISRFDSSGELQWSTYISEAPEGTYNSGYGMINDQNDNLFFYGSSSINLPDETWNTLNPGGGAYQDNQGTNGGGRKTLLIKFNPNESMYWSTLFGGENRHNFEGSSGWIWQDFRDIVVDSNGDIILAGSVNTTDFPTLDPGNGAYFQDTHSPGGGWATDGVMTRFTNNGVLQWSTYYGGDWGGVGAGDGTDLQGLAIDGQDNIFVFGHTWAQGFPTQNMTDSYFKGTLGERDYVFMMFDNDNNRQWSTFFGGSGREFGSHGIGSKSNACGIDLFIFGATNSNNYPLVDFGGGALYESTKTSTNANTISYFSYGIGGSAPPGNTWTWTGMINTDWFEPCNWDKLSVPTSTADVLIPSAPANQPIISGDSGHCKTIEIQSLTGAELTIDVDNGGGLEVHN